MTQPTRHQGLHSFANWGVSSTREVPFYKEYLLTADVCDLSGVATGGQRGSPVAPQVAQTTCVTVTGIWVSGYP